MIAASTASNTTSWTAHPNSGRIGRSPGAVPRISPIACSMSSSARASAIPPRWSTPSGKESPEPRMSDTRHHLSEGDHRAADLHAGTRQLDLGGAAFQRERRRALEVELRLSLDADVLTLDLERLRRFQRRLA